MPELRGAFDDLKRATGDSIRWVLGDQRRRGAWETYIPTGPADVGRLDSTVIGAAAYFHPLRLHMGSKPGDDVDRAARLTLDTPTSTSSPAAVATRPPGTPTALT